MFLQLIPASVPGHFCPSELLVCLFGTVHTHHVRCEGQGIELLVLGTGVLLLCHCSGIAGQWFGQVSLGIHQNCGGVFLQVKGNEIAGVEQGNQGKRAELRGNADEIYKRTSEQCEHNAIAFEDEHYA